MVTAKTNKKEIVATICINLSFIAKGSRNQVANPYTMQNYVMKEKIMHK